MGRLEKLHALCGHQLRALDSELRVTYVPQRTGLAGINLRRNAINFLQRLMNMSSALPSLADSKEDRKATWIRIRTVICGKNTYRPSDINSRETKD